MKMRNSQTLSTFMVSLVVSLLVLLTPRAQAATEMFFIHNDHLGTPQVVTDQNQTVVWEGRQKPFGETEATTNSLDSDARFPGQYLDEESGLYYNYFRDYDPTIGRYIQSDPIGLRGGINTYAYVGGNPLIYSDPYGQNANILARPIANFLAKKIAEGIAATTGIALNIDGSKSDRPTLQEWGNQQAKDKSETSISESPNNQNCPENDPCQKRYFADKIECEFTTSGTSYAKCMIKAWVAWRKCKNMNPPNDTIDPPSGGFDDPLSPGWHDGWG